MVKPLAILQAWAEARAILWREHYFDLDEALAPLREYALRTGIVAELGSAQTWALIEAPFGNVFEDVNGHGGAAVQSEA